jgi:predicted nuclease with TOPRIM domain
MLDTHAAIKELTKAGLSEAAAEAIVQVQLRTLHQGLATKEDILSLKLGMEQRFTEIEKRFTEIEKHFTEIEQRFTEIEQHLTDIEKRFGNMERRFTEIEKRFGNMERRFSGLDTRLNRISVLTWAVLIIVLISNPIAARILERILGISL